MKETYFSGQLPIIKKSSFHMRRSAVSAGRPGGLIRGIAWKGNMRAALSDEKRKTLGVILIFLYFIYAFRSISYAFRSLHPKITKNLPIK
jgi:hypothetical protein